MSISSLAAETGVNTNALRYIEWTYVARAILALIALGAFIVFPGLAVEAISFAVWNVILTGPLIAIGILLTAGITATGSAGLIAAAFEGRDIRMILVASFIGALTPVCGVTVLPLIAGLLAGGVPLASIMAFWLSSPITDPGMLAITAATLGWPFAATKAVAAFGIGVFGGLITWMLVRSGFLSMPAKDRGVVYRIAGSVCASPAVSSVKWQFWQDRERVRAFRETAYETGRLMLMWLFAAFIAEFLMKLYLPDQLVASIVGQNNIWAVPLAATVGAPIYLDGYAALPLIRGLVDSGMRPDAAMAFLIAGGITSAWAAIPVFALVRLSVFFLYLCLALASAMLAGFISGFVL